ncbi:MAG TPA: SMC-Scp complex subunit ScpB [bacterium]|jgi:segregation and condensation protein B|nr:SMC-Scp complex subunit ScpB [bacterium]HNT66787.1 SMC-Scp complex subunit ScpB [bacterium]
MDKIDLIHILESIIFASDSPLSIRQMESIVEGVERAEIEDALQRLQDELQNRAFFLKKVAGGYILATRPEYAPYVKKMFSGKERSRLSRAALETLAIIAFKQPISRVEINAIRGVDSDGVIKGLLERRLIDISGRDDGPGRALLFRTTAEFLKYFGIDDISELPKPKEIEQLLAEGEGGKILQNIPEEQLLQDEAEKVQEEATSTTEGADVEQGDAAAEKENN